MTIPAVRAAASLLLGAALVATGAASPALAAKNEQKETKPKAPPAVIETMKGVQYRMANSKMAEKVTRIADAEADQHTNEGEPAPDAPEHTDLVAVYVASSKMPAKLLTKMAADFPRGTSGSVPGSYYGEEAAWELNVPMVFIAAEMAAKRPDDAPGQQLQIGLDGPAAQPLSVETSGDPLIGLERLSLSGYFNNGAWASGSTDLSEREPFEDIPYYNTDSGVFGYYDSKARTYYAVMPRTTDVQAVTVSVRSSTDQGEIVDDLEMPGGGAFVDLRSASGGFAKKAGVDPLSCRALETYSAESGEVIVSEAGATQILYTAGVHAATDPDVAAELLAEAQSAVGSVPMLVTPVGTDGEPFEVDGEVAMAPDIAAMTLTLEVPPGRWAFAPVDGAGPKTPSGERLIDHSSLTGGAGVVTGPGLDGVVAGDPLCGIDDFDVFADPDAEEEEFIGDDPTLDES